MSRFRVALLFIVALLISAGTGVFVFFHSLDLMRHDDARSWPTAQGTIVRSERVSFKGSKGRTNYRATIAYSFVHAGREHRGTRIHDERESSSTSRATADERLRGYSMGAPVQVYVNPQNPTDSQLIAGIQNGDRMLTGAAIASAVGTMFFWTFAFHAVRRRGSDHVAGKLVIPGPPLRVRSTTIGNLAGALLTAALVIVGVSTLMGLTAGLSWLWLALSVVLGIGAGALAYWINLRSDAKGKGDLVLDLDAEFIITPKLSHSPARTVGYSTITGTTIAREVRGNGKSRATTYEVNLVLGETSGPTAAVFSSKKPAKAFDLWLRQQLALEAPAAV